MSGTECGLKGAIHFMDRGKKCDKSLSEEQMTVRRQRTMPRRIAR